MTSLMPSKKTWTSPDGVTIEMITYRTVLVDRLRDGLSTYKNDDGSLPDSLAQFILVAATTTDITLPDTDTPLWGQVLHDAVKSPTWLRTPASLYDSLMYAPSDLMDNWWTAYQVTRDTAHQAPLELQQTPPLPAEAYEAAGEEDEDKLNFTESSTSSGTPSLTVMSSNARETPSRDRRRKAT